jgi:hypothetical protein
LDDVPLLVQNLVAVDVFQKPDVFRQDAMRVLRLRVFGKETLYEDR